MTILRLMHSNEDRTRALNMSASSVPYLRPVEVSQVRPIEAAPVRAREAQVGQALTLSVAATDHLPSLPRLPSIYPRTPWGNGLTRLPSFSCARCGLASRRRSPRPGYETPRRRPVSRRREMPKLQRRDLARVIAFLKRRQQAAWLRVRASEYRWGATMMGPPTRQEFLDLATRFEELAVAVQRMSK